MPECELAGLLDHACWGGMHEHHRKLRRFKDERPENKLRVCMNAHAILHNHPDAYDRGWLVHSWDDPAEIPVR